METLDRLVMQQGDTMPAETRSQNERLVMSLIRGNGPMGGADIARATGLSAQTASVITRSLEADGFLRRGAPVKGKVGKPITPLRLNPDGVFSYGLRIGRRSADFVMIDFAGRVRGHRETHYPYPTPPEIAAFARDGLAALPPACAAPRVAGIGIAAPFELWNWLDLVGDQAGEMESWRHFDFAEAFADFTPHAVRLGNDISLACFGEQQFGSAGRRGDFGYFYVGAFVGGGVILGNRLLHGGNGNAGAFGSIPVDIGGARRQLIECASIYTLERRLAGAGLDPQLLWADGADWSGLGAPLHAWLVETSQALATAIVAVTAVLDQPMVVIDGSLPAPVRARLTEMTQAAMSGLNTCGIVVPVIVEGTLGRMAGAIGAAYEPIAAHYLID